MAVNLRRVFVIWGMALKNRLMERMMYRLNFFFMTVGVVFQMVLTLAFVKVIFSFITNLSGWEYNQALIVAASYMIVEGILWAGCSYLQTIVLQVRAGTLDVLMVKPMDTQLLVTIWMGDTEDWARVVTAIAVFIFAIRGIDLNAMDLLVNSFAYAYLIACACIILYSIALFFRTLTFWLTDGGNLWVMIDTITKTSQYPTDIFYQKVVRIFFSSVLPIAFIATIPAKIFIHGPNLLLTSIATFLAASFFVISRRFWLYGLDHYTSASS